MSTKYSLRVKLNAPALKLLYPVTLSAGRTSNVLVRGRFRGLLIVLSVAFSTSVIAMMESSWALSSISAGRLLLANLGPPVDRLGAFHGLCNHSAGFCRGETVGRSHRQHPHVAPAKHQTPHLAAIRVARKLVGAFTFGIDDGIGVGELDQVNLYLA